MLFSPVTVMPVSPVNSQDQIFTYQYMSLNFISPDTWQIGKRMEGNLGVVAKEQFMRIITEKTLELISPRFHLEASAEVSLDKLRGLTNMNCTISCVGEKNLVQTMNNICLVQMCIVEIT